VAFFSGWLSGLEKYATTRPKMITIMINNRVKRILFLFPGGFLGI
jgi:hypothetical protein